MHGVRYRVYDLYQNNLRKKKTLDIMREKLHFAEKNGQRREASLLNINFSKGRTHKTRMATFIKAKLKSV